MIKPKYFADDVSKGSAAYKIYKSQEIFQGFMYTR